MKIKEWPKLNTVEKWDGGEAPVIEEEFSLEELMETICEAQSSDLNCTCTLLQHRQQCRCSSAVLVRVATY